MKGVTYTLLAMFMACDHTSGSPDGDLTGAADGLPEASEQALAVAEARGLTLEVDTGDEVVVQTLVAIRVVAADGVSPPATWRGP